MKQKIAILIDSLKSGGAQKQSAILANSLSPYYEIIFVVFDKNDAKKNFADILREGDAIHVQLYNGNKLSLLRKLYSFLKKEQPAIIISYLPFGNLVNGLIGKAIGTKYRIGGIRNSEVPKLKFWVQKYVHNWFLTASISNSIAGQQSHVEGGYNKKPIFFIPNAFPLKEAPMLRTSTDTVTIISVGRFVDQKNYSLAIESIKTCIDLAKKQAPQLNLKYQIIGYGELEKEVRDLSAQSGYGSQIEIIINPPNINDYYQGADIYLCTSRFEGLSNSIMEAMSFSLPVIATNVGGNPQLVHTGNNGYLTNETSEDVSSQLLKLALNGEQRTRFGANSYAIIKNEYSETAFFNNYNTLIENEFKA